MFPLAEHLAEVEAAEEHALDQARAAFDAHPHDIACFIAEPIQGEGGDNHMRPEFLAAMQADRATTTTRCSSSTRCRPASG